MEDENEDVSSYWMSIRKQNYFGNSKTKHSVENSFWNTLWACRKTDYVLLIMMMMMMMMMTIIIIIIVILGISFMQGIYAYIPDTNHVPREHCVATILM